MRKPQQNSKNSLQLNKQVSFNILDPEQKADYDFADTWLNFSGEVKQWIRSRRLGGPMAVMSVGDVQTDLPQMDEEEALGSIM